MMRFVTVPLNSVVTALFLTLSVTAAGAQSPAEDRAAQIDGLLERLAVPDLAEWESVENQIARLWSQSGSAAMDLLLRRGREALEANDYDAAIDHLTALTDHAPDFAEGWNARATAFFANNQYGPALEDVQRVLALEPRHFNALQGLGLIMREMGQEDLALRAFRMAASIHPNDPDLKDLLERLEATAGGQDI